MDELSRFTDPWDAIGLRVWRKPERSRLIARLKRIPPRQTIPWRRGYLILRELFGEDYDDRESLELSYAYQRLLVLDWMTGFRVLGFFNEAEVRDYAALAGPPQDSILGHFWYGLLGGESPQEIETIYRRRVAVEKRRRAHRCVIEPFHGDLISQAMRLKGDY
jgi:hypothetical protein